MCNGKSTRLRGMRPELSPWWVSGTAVLFDYEDVLCLLELQFPQPEKGWGGVGSVISAVVVSEHMPLYFLKNSTTNIKNFNSQGQKTAFLASTPDDSRCW